MKEGGELFPGTERPQPLGPNGITKVELNAKLCVTWARGWPEHEPRCMARQGHDQPADLELGHYSSSLNVVSVNYLLPSGGHGKLDVMRPYGHWSLVVDPLGPNEEGYVSTNVALRVPKHREL